VNRRILILGEGATELRAPGDRWSGCARVLLHRLFGSPSEDLLSFEEHVLSRFRRDSDLVGDEPRVRGEDEQARLARKLAARDSHGLVLVRDDDRRDRRGAVERGFEEARAEGHVVPAVLALAIECIEAWALSDPDAWLHVFGRVPTLPAQPEVLWGNVRDPTSNHPKHVLRRCLAEIDRRPGGNAAARLLEHASLERIASACPRGFGRFVADLRRAFPPIVCVVAASIDRAIGLDGEPPWGGETLRDHVDHLRRLVSTSGDRNRIAVIVGRKTLQALPALPEPSRRIDIVITRDATYDGPAHVIRASSFDDALVRAAAAQVDRVCVLGGGELYGEALGHFRCTDLHYTRVDRESPGADTFFPDFETNPAWVCGPTSTQHHDNGFDYRIEHWSRFAR
jgi:dihydrofolate reductase